MPHIKILSQHDIEIFEHPPRFSNEGRRLFFEAPKWANEMLEKFRSPTNKVGFILQLGYFTAIKKFFITSRFHPNDVEFVVKKLGITLSDIQLSGYKKSSLKRHREIILEKLGFQKFDKKSKAFVSAEANDLCSSRMKPRLMFLSLVEFLRQKRIEVPSYHALSEVITGALLAYEKNLLFLVEKYITERGKQLLNELLEVSNFQHDEGNQSLKIKRHRITHIKKTNQSTQPTKIKQNVCDLLLLRNLFHELSKVIENLDLPKEMIQYFAQLAIKSEVFQISRSEKRKYLYLIAFVIHQYYRLNDYLIEILMHVVQTFVNSSEREHKERYYKTRKARHQAIHEVSTTVSTYMTTLQEIEAVTYKKLASDKEKIRTIKYLLRKEEAPQYSEIQNQLGLLEKESSRIVNEEDYYDILEEKSIKMQNRLSLIVKHLNFDKETSDEPLLRAISYYRQKDSIQGKDVPLDFIECKEQKIIYGQRQKIRVSLYKVLLYREIALAIKSGALNLLDSYKYRAFEEYLVSLNIWKTRKNELLEKAELTKFKSFEQLKSKLKTDLSHQYKATNENINSGKNKYAKIDQQGNVKISTPKVEKGALTTTIGDLMPKHRLISLFEILSTVDKFSSFLDCFEHWKIKHNREKPEKKTFFAGVVGLGCNHGIKRIGKISHGINQSRLENTVNWYFSVDGLNMANNKILELTEQLELSKIFRKDKDIIHTSSDGQKFRIGVESLNSNYSFKYLGKDRGVSIYSFIDAAHRLFSSTVISSAQREAHYVIDGLMHNDVIKSDIHSTDTHGYSEIIFAVMFLLGVSFAPRIKNFMKQILYSFEFTSTLKKRGYKILPEERINIKIIEDNWDDILRFVATIKLKETTASQLFRRLSSYSRHHPLYQALQELGRIIKSSFLLKYIDDVELRQAIEKILNKIESSNKFGSAVFHGENQEFQQETKEKQMIAEGCKRLIQNAIVCWNYLYLSQTIRDASTEEKQNLFHIIQNGSVVTWQHVNLRGEYDFSDNVLQDSFDFKLPELLKLKFA